MQPTINQGDLVIYRPFKSTQKVLKERSIILVRHPLDAKTIIIKRIHRNTPFGIELKGDNEMESIDSRQFGLINYDQVLGIVEKIISTRNN